MAIAEATSLSFRNPQGGARFIEPPAPVEPMAPAQAQTMLPPLNEDLAQIQGLTDRYYDSYGKLKSFVESMNSQGIDVTKPQYGDPAKMELFNTYKMLEANLITTAQQLKNEQKIRTQMAPQLIQDKIRYAEGIDPTTQLVGIRDPRDVYFSTELEPGVQQALNILKENPMTPQDRANQVAYFDEVNRELDNRINSAQSPVEKQRLQYQKEQLTKAYQATKLFAPPNPFSSASIGFTTKTQGAEAIARQFTYAKHGISGFDQKEITPDGDVVLVNPTYAGWKMSSAQVKPKGSKTFARVDKIIKDFIRKDGKTFIRFQSVQPLKTDGTVDEDKEPITPDPVELTARNVGQTLAEIFEANKSEIGMSYNEWLGYLKSAGLLEKGSNNVNEAQILKDPETGKPLQGQTIDSTAVKSYLSGLMKDVKSRIITSRDVILPGGTKSNIKINPTKTGIIGFRDDVWEIIVDGEVVDTVSDPEDIKKYFIENNLLTFLLPENSQPSTPSTPASREIDPDI